jgi:membrane fusion protein (multidrug efflux system)
MAMTNSQTPPPSVTPIANAAPEAARSKQGNRRLLVVGALFLVAVGGYFSFRALGANEETTDDASVDAAVVPVSLRAAGQVLVLHASDNARVKKGDVLVEIDPAEATARVEQAQGELEAAEAQNEAAVAQLEIATASARGGLSSAQAQVSTSRAQVGSADAQIAQAKAQLVRAQAEAHKAEVDLQRANTLRAANAIPESSMDAAQSANDSAQAGLQSAKAQLSAAEQGRHVAQSRVMEASGMLSANEPIEAKIAAAKAAASLAHARVTTAKASLELARIALSYTQVVAPSDGTVAKFSLHEGQLVSAGQMVAQIVPDTSYVVANFKETQVGRMKPGQHVSLEIDTYPGVQLTGVVESLTPGTGSRFSVLAPDNASGNFVKVVQRVPVRIKWDSVPGDVVIRPGMSVVAHVHVGG